VPTCLSEIIFGSFLAYSPRGNSPDAIKSRTLTYQIKSDRGGTIPRLTERLAKEIATSESCSRLGKLLGLEATLVPCPRSYLLVKGGLWPGEQIAKSLVASGLGKLVEPWLERIKAIPKSSAAEPGKRPKIQDHLSSMRVNAESTIFPPRRIVVIDDVITKGATLIAAVSLLKEKFPTADVKAFALIRTLGLKREFARILDPCIGTVMNLEGEAEREP
jgi:hypothetical protein